MVNLMSKMPTIEQRQKAVLHLENHIFFNSR